MDSVTASRIRLHATAFPVDANQTPGYDPVNRGEACISQGRKARSLELNGLGLGLQRDARAGP